MITVTAPLASFVEFTQKGSSLIWVHAVAGLGTYYPDNEGTASETTNFKSSTPRINRSCFQGDETI